MFNKTEMLYISMGRNERWSSHTSSGFTFPEEHGKPIIVRRSNSSISPENKKAAMRAAKPLKT